MKILAALRNCIVIPSWDEDLLDVDLTLMLNQPNYQWSRLRTEFFRVEEAFDFVTVLK